VRARDRIDLLSNVLVVVAPAASATPFKRPEDLLSATRLALGDPAGVPAGIYARRWLESIGLWDKVRPNVVPSLNVRAALAAVESENAELGIVYRTDAAVTKRVKVVWEVPAEQGPAIVYPLATLAASTKPATGQAVRYLTSDRAREIYKRLGFGVPARP
jgi:molybdate transport system substrate-binding protein